MISCEASSCSDLQMHNCTDRICKAFHQYEFSNEGWGILPNLSQSHTGYTYMAFPHYAVSNACVNDLHWRRHMYNGGICLTSPHCGPLYAFLDYFQCWMRKCIDHICRVSLCCELFGAFSNGSYYWWNSHTGHIYLTFHQGGLLNVTSDDSNKQMNSRIDCICATSSRNALSCDSAKNLDKSMRDCIGCITL